MEHKILLVEDSKEIYQMVLQAFGASLQVSWASTIDKAQSLIEENQFDLILLDVELPDGNGFDFCSMIQLKSPEVPIFFLTCHTNLSDKVLGFSAGADDYITKPFNLLELKARVEAKLKKVEIIKKSSDVYKWDEIEINKNSQEVKVLNNEKYENVDLTALEFKMLMLFASQPNTVIHRDKILDEIWGENIHVYSRSVDTHVSKLRKKLGPVSHIIESVHGSGYKFSP